MGQPNEPGTAALDRLIARLHKVRHTGQQRWVACCPAHDDSHPSLSLRQLPDGRILLHCFADCAVTDVVAAVGMDMTDLFPPPIEGVHRRAKVNKPFNLHDAVRCLAADALLIVQCSNVMLHGGKLTPATHQSLVAAAARFQTAEGMLDA